MRVAIIGGGISGLSAAYALHRDNEVRLYDAESPVGGHVKTVTVDTADGPLAVDMGFIVHNDVTYPTFVRMLGELGVATQASDMSPGLGLPGVRSWSSALAALGAGSPSHRQSRDPGTGECLPDVLRFYRDARARLDAGSEVAQTLGGLSGRASLRARLPGPLPDPDHVAVWSTASDRIHDFPIEYLLRFLDHHGLIGVGRASSGGRSRAGR